MKKLKKVICLTLAGLMLVGSGDVAVAQEKSNDISIQNNLTDSYEMLLNYAKRSGIDLDIEMGTFVKEYEDSSYTNVNDYVKAYYKVLDNKPLSLSNNTGILSNAIGAVSKWYYNTGNSLPQAANYSKYNLLNTVQKGDIIFEANGGLGITAHVAIVEGIFYSEAQQQYYIRIIESNLTGVVRSVLDDSRVDDSGVTVLRVSSANSTQKNNAVNFCIRQLGKNYSLDFAKDSSENEKDWYCSELVWAGYYNQGINIETTGFYNEPGITPRDIYNSSAVTKVTFSK